MNSLGVIGGLGPMATAYLLELITDMTDARTDQEHLDAIIFQSPECAGSDRIHFRPYKALPCAADDRHRTEIGGAGCVRTRYPVRDGTQLSR